MQKATPQEVAEINERIAHSEKPILNLRKLTQMITVEDESIQETIQIPASIEANRLALAVSVHKVRKHFHTMLEDWVQNGVARVVKTREGNEVIRTPMTPHDFESLTRTLDGLKNVSIVAYGDSKSMLAGADIQASDVVRNTLAAIMGFKAGQAAAGEMPMTPAQFAKKLQLKIKKRAAPIADSDGEVETVEPEIVG